MDHQTRELLAHAFDPSVIDVSVPLLSSPPSLLVGDRTNTNAYYNTDHSLVGSSTMIGWSAAASWFGSSGDDIQSWNDLGATQVDVAIAEPGWEPRVSTITPLPFVIPSPSPPSPTLLPSLQHHVPQQYSSHHSHVRSPSTSTPTSSSSSSSSGAERDGSSPTQSLHDDEVDAVPLIHNVPSTPLLVPDVDAMADILPLPASIVLDSIIPSASTIFMPSLPITVDAIPPPSLGPPHAAAATVPIVPPNMIALTDVVSLSPVAPITVMSAASLAPRRVMATTSKTKSSSNSTIHSMHTTSTIITPTIVPPPSTSIATPATISVPVPVVVDAADVPGVAPPIIIRGPQPVGRPSVACIVCYNSKSRCDGARPCAR
jgi:hypothetical protein